MVKTCVIKLRGVEGRDAHDQIALCTFHSFSVEVQMNAGYLQYMEHMCNNNLKIRIGRAPLVACNYYAELYNI